ncbi:hypothetical protein HMPREF0322_01490 [Desulfitobacterium hafniense DP7]|uniref:ABC-2 type transporter n=1 Tax=Desulfitobacterium hafniense DP7 TaxID=537010 RepID=G9XKK7_DESHA|nr:ABC transporter permease subunit [Desulfitobacterium hafniense]EHL07801.1 hypothetical protein HMPREF0322_01490 [Desulfitobacterium hafniense DP7]
MGNLLTAGFYRLGKNKVFWLGMLAMLAISAGMMLNASRQAGVMMAEGYLRTLDDYYFKLAPVIGLFCAIFASLFIGTEHSEGTLRNKIVVGRTRPAIYLANYVICFAAGVCFVVVWLLGGLVGIPVLGVWEMGANGVLLYVVTALCFTGAWTGMFTLLAMLSSNKATTAVLAILLALGLLVAAALLYNGLCVPELNSGMVITKNGMEMAEPTPNPNYVSGMKRTLYQLVLDCLPSGQGILMANRELSRPLLSLAASGVIALATTAAGVFAFGKKDLK